MLSHPKAFIEKYSRSEIVIELHYKHYEYTKQGIKNQLQLSLFLLKGNILILIEIYFTFRAFSFDSLSLPSTTKTMRKTVTTFVFLLFLIENFIYNLEMWKK